MYDMHFYILYVLNIFSMLSISQVVVFKYIQCISHTYMRCILKYSLYDECIEMMHANKPKKEPLPNSSLLSANRQKEIRK